MNYPNNDMMSVYTHYDPKTGKNVQTPNVLPSKNDEEEKDKNNGKNSD